MGSFSSGGLSKALVGREVLIETGLPVIPVLPGVPGAKEEEVLEDAVVHLLPLGDVPLEKEGRDEGLPELCG